MIVVALVLLIPQLFIDNSTDKAIEIDEVTINPVDPHEIASVIQIVGESGWIDGGYPGSGTQEDPYVVEDLHLGSDSTCLSIYDTDSYFVMRDCSFSVTIMHQDWGLYGISGVILHNVTNGNIENCEIQSNACGIFLSDSKDCSVQNNLVTADIADIVLDESTSCTLENNVLNGRGIYIDEPYYYQHDSSFWDHNLEGNTLRGIQIGSFVGLEDSVLDGESYSQVFLRGSNNVTVVGGSFNNVRLAFAMIGSIDCSIVNVSTGVTRREIVMLGCINCSLNGGKLESDDSSILIKESLDCSVFNTDGGNSSVYLRDSTGSQVCTNILRNIDVNYSNDSLFEKNTARRIDMDRLIGVTLRQNDLDWIGGYWVQTCLIVNNTVQDWWWESISVHLCSDIDIIANQFHSRVSIYWSDEVNFSDNYVSPEYNTEVSLASCSNTTVHNNQLVNSSFWITNNQQEWTYDFSNNTANSKPVLYLHNQENVTIAEDEYSQLFVIDSQNIEVKDSSFSNVSMGVMVFDSEGCSFDNVTFQNCYRYQLFIQESSQISVSNSDFVGETNYAIFIEDVSGCSVSNSTIEQRVSVETATSIRFSQCNLRFQELEYDIGLKFRHVNSSTIESCTITDADTLVTIDRSKDIQIHNNQLDAGVMLLARFGIYDSVNLTLSGNVFWNCQFDLDGDRPDHWDHQFTNNWKDGKPLVYRKDMSDKHISLDLYGHLILVSCENILVSSTGDLVRTGIQVVYSDNIEFMGLNLNLHRYSPIRIFSSDNVRFQDCNLIDNGIHFVQSQNLAMIRCQILVADVLTFSDCSSVVVENCLIESARMYFLSGSCVSIESCTFRIDSQVQGWRVSDIMISECDFFGGYRGVQLTYCNNVRLKGVSITDCYGDALQIRNSRTINVHSCRFYNSYIGIDLTYNSGGYFTSNWIFDCGFVGINVYGSYYLNFWNNALAGNDVNARESNSENCTWDNGSGWGNYWSDATEGIPYVIGEDSTSVDRYPRVLPNPDWSNPEISSPSDVTVWVTPVEDTTIVWRTIDDNPLDYWIEIDGVFFESGEVQGGNIEFSIPSLEVGNYDVTIVVIDPLGRSTSDVVTVQVIEVPLSHILSIILFAAYHGFLITMTIGLSAFLIIEGVRDPTFKEIHFSLRRKITTSIGRIKRKITRG
jgi:parallel beta-helix repeat protein